MIYNFLRDIAARQREALFQYGVVQVGEIDGEPITLETARAHCRVDTHEEGSPPLTVSDDDAWLTDIGIPVAREYIEAQLGVALAPRTVELVAASFPSTSFTLPFGPVQSITSVIYLDADSVEQTMADTDYVLDDFSVPARLILATGASWPTSNGATGSVAVRYVTGYSLPEDSPQVIVLPKLAMSMMLLMLGHLYINRESTAEKAILEVPLGIESMAGLFPGRERLGFA